MSILLAVDQELARGRRVDQREDAGERGLAAAALADDGQRLALLDREADALDGMHGPARLREQAAADMIVADDVAAFEDDLAHDAAPAIAASSSRIVGDGRQPVARRVLGQAESSARV